MGGMKWSRAAGRSCSTGLRWVEGEGKESEWHRRWTLLKAQKMDAVECLPCQTTGMEGLIWKGPSRTQY